MNELLWIGSVLGAAIGLAHAVYLWRASAYEGEGSGAAIYRGVWAFGLWTLFGTYVLVFWVVGLVAYGLAGYLPARRKA